MNRCAVCVSAHNHRRDPAPGARPHALLSSPPRKQHGLARGDAAAVWPVRQAARGGVALAWVRERKLVEFARVRVRCDV